MGHANIAITVDRYAPYARRYLPVRWRCLHPGQQQGPVFAGLVAPSGLLYTPSC
jgi:hypothetical protein